MLCVLAIDPQNELSEIWTVTPLISYIDGVAVLNSSKVLLMYLTDGQQKPVDLISALEPSSQTFDL